MQHKKTKLPRILTVSNILNKSVERLDFSEKFHQAYGRPQSTGFWFMYGSSASGKSTKAMMMGKEFARMFKTLYHAIEEDMDDSDFIDRMKMLKMQDVAGNFFVQQFTLNQLDEYLSKPKSAHAVIIDSSPYIFNTWDEYYEFKKKWHKKKLILIIGHAEGKKPRTELQKSIKYDCKMKIFVSGYLAVCQGRTIGPNGGTFIIWEEGYNKIQGEKSHLNG